MEIEYYGANCFKITYKKAVLIVDDNLTDLGAKAVTKESNIALFTQDHVEYKVASQLIIDQPGEYEASNVSIVGIAARSHADEANQKSSVIFKLVADEIRIGIIGHIYPELNDEQLEAIGTVDILIIPVGGNDYTLDGAGALKIIKKIEPKVVIPSHYDDKKLKYPVAQNDLETALKSLAMEAHERLPRLKIKPAELMTDGTRLTVLERQ